MRSNRKILSGVLLLAGVAIFAVLYLSLSNISRRLATSPRAPAPRPVSVAPAEENSGSGNIFVSALDIPAGSIITREMLRPKAYQGPTREPFITNPEAQALGFITRVPIARDSQIRPEDDFIGHISETGIAGVLRPGTRAMILPLTGKPTLHDLVRIGNSVDVLAAFDGQESRSIVQDVRVLAVDVFANDFPQVNAAMRGPYKADARGRGIDSNPSAPAAATGETVPSETATPAPTPAQGTPRPDAALTLEVTPEQGARIQLAIASNAALDYLVRPALPGNRSTEPGALIAGAETEGGEAGSAGTIQGNLLVRPVAVTRAQIAPYAERKKAGASSTNNSGGSGGGASNRSALNETGNTPIRTRRVATPLPPFPPISSTVSSLPPANPIPSGSGTPNFPGESGDSSTSVGSGAPSSYQIPIYANGNIVRNETVLTPQEQ